MRQNVLRISVLLLVGFLAIAALACDDDGDGDNGVDPPTATAGAPADDPTEPADGDGATVEVSLLEFQVIADAASASAGAVSFATSNVGGANHELVVIRTDLAADALPTNADGSVDESGEGIEVIGETAELTPQENETLEADLESGAYVLICNVVDTSGAHYDLGMTMAFEVTE